MRPTSIRHLSNIITRPLATARHLPAQQLKVFSSPTNSSAEKLSQEVAKKIGPLPKFSRPNQGTIGIAGNDMVSNSQLAVKITEAGSKVGLKNDQDHPEIKVINFTNDPGIESLIFQAQMLVVGGCDVIAVLTSDLNQQQKDLLGEAIKPIKSTLIYLEKYEKYDDFAKRILDEVLSTKAKLRPNIFDVSSYEKIKASIAEDIRLRCERINASSSIQVALQNNNIQGAVGAIGGAGPMTSSLYSLMLSKKGIPHAYISDTGSASKAQFSLQTGHSFLPHFQNDMLELKTFGCTYIAMVCNAAHLFCRELFDDDELKDLKLIHIADSVVDYFEEDQKQSSKKIILLGADAAVGIDKDGNSTEGLFDRRLQEKDYEVIKPNRSQQDEIMKAIYFAKEGKMGDTRNIVYKVIQELREEYKDDNARVALVCTDLPIAFSEDELPKVGASTIQTLSALTSKMIADGKLSEHSVATISSRSR
jgi:aspartate/glutamate racemase